MGPERDMPMTGAGGRRSLQPQMPQTSTHEGMAVTELNPDDYVVPADPDQLAVESEYDHPIVKMRRHLDGYGRRSF